MIFQLPNGKVINISIDEYLLLTDEDIQALVALNIGEFPTSYWYRSCIETEGPVVDMTDEEIILLSFEDQDEFLTDLSKFDINSIPDDGGDFTDI